MPSGGRPPHHWKTTTLVAGLKATGVIAPFVLDGPITGEAFRIYVEDVLAPELEAGDAVVMDNLRVHKVKGVEEAIRAVGASVLPLPSYSPDLNPIEPFFAKLKALLRKTAARTKEVGRHRPTPRRVHARGVPKLPRTLRIPIMSSCKSERL
jgi:transposase